MSTQHERSHHGVWDPEEPLFWRIALAIMYGLGYAFGRLESTLGRRS